MQKKCSKMILYLRKNQQHNYYTTALLFKEGHQHIIIMNTYK